jgi:hypothetical protein
MLPIPVDSEGRVSVVELPLLNGAIRGTAALRRDDADGQVAPKAVIAKQ